MKKLFFAGIWMSLVLLANANVPGDKTADIRAVRNFTRIYKDASEVRWESLKDGGYICRFLQNGVMKRAFYGGRGEWLTTIAGYTAGHLPADVRRQVHSIYYDYSILYVNEISMPGKPVSYVVQVQDRRAIKIVRVLDGEMEEIQEIETL